MRRLAVFLALSGCSFAFVSGPPPDHARLSYFDCTTSRLAPVLDTVLTGLMALNVLTLGAASDADWASSNHCNPGDPNCPAISRNGATIIDGALGIAGAAGMIYGFSKTGACREAKHEQALRGSPQQPMPGSWPPPQGGQPQPGTWPPPQGGPPQPGTWPPPQGAPQQPGYPAPGQPQPSTPPPAQPTPPQQPAPAPAPAQ